MKRFLTHTLAAVLFANAFLLSPTASQIVRAQAKSATTELRPAPLAQAEIDRIVRAFTANETIFRTALNNYSFKREAVIQTIGMGGQITGEYRRDSRFVFDDQSRRYERITFFPMPTLTAISITTEDLEDLGGVQPFALEASKINLYDFAYLGKERIDELDLYVFDVTPKILPDPKKSQERFFKGRVWVDDRDLQIVKARGKGVPEGKQRFPTFDTYREQIDGKFWFPTYTYADDVLEFAEGNSVRVRMRVKYTDYKPLKATVEIVPDETDDMEVPAEAPPAAPPGRP